MDSEVVQTIVEAFIYYFNGASTLFRQIKDGNGGSEPVANLTESLRMVGTDACFVYGIGREGSRHGVEEFTELKYVMLGGLGA